MPLMFKSYISWVVVWGFVFLVAFFLGFTPEVTTQTYHGPSAGVWIFGILSTVFALIGFFATQNEITCHAHNLSKLKTYKDEIKNQEEHLANVKENFEGLRASLQETLKDLPEQLMNQDNPVSSLVKALMEEVNRAERDLVKTRNYKLQHEAKIHARTIGPWCWIVEKWGDGS